jgi:DNA-binding XRE family transcriptional regulator
MSDSLTSAAVARRLRELRIHTQVTPARLAQAVGVSAESLLDVEEGRSRPSIAMLAGMASHLGTSLRRLVREVGEGSAVAKPSPMQVEDIGRAIAHMEYAGNKLQYAESAAVHYALATCHGNRSAAARMLGVERRRLLRRARRLPQRLPRP